ncbi:MAG: hypothetical protein KKA28_16580 [Planctomycetes bacterium]|nr:hypothetical protein [Planctomycetota bacterium]MCG2684879.1 hypothetical protein [Planctomycetales bacterium]
MFFISICRRFQPGKNDEPATVIVWSLLGAASWLGMRVWRRRRRACLRP